MKRRGDAAVGSGAELRSRWRLILMVLLSSGVAAAVTVDEAPLERHFDAARSAPARGETERARRELQLSLQSNPLDAQAHFPLASLLGREGELDQASEAAAGTPADRLRFKARHPDGDRPAPNRCSSHFFLMENSAVYRAASGMDLANENFDFALLGQAARKKGFPRSR